MKRYPFLDWTRGIAVLVMIQCHAFNSLTRLDLRHSSAYIFTQFVGGMAAPLFLFMAGMTAGFQMESLTRREPSPTLRWTAALRRAGYILFIAFAFRASNFVASLPSPSLAELTKVDILNCMGLAMAVFSLVALFNFHQQVKVAILAALLVAAAAPVFAAFDWTGAAPLLRDYLVPGPDKSRFPLFPCGSYVGFGMAAGLLVKHTDAERMDRLMQWAVIIGLVLIFSAEYCANLPYSLYAHSDFWRNSPALILIRVGITLLLLAVAYLWTCFGRAPAWNWLQNLGKTSLLVYWVHIMLVYGNIIKPLKRALTIPQAALATVIVMMLMVALSETKLRWKERQRERWRAGTTVAGPAEA